MTPTRKPSRKDSTTLGKVILFFFLFFLPQAKAEVLRVKCDNGKKIQKKLELAVSGDVIKVSGTCSENITIRTSSITHR